MFDWEIKEMFYGLGMPVTVYYENKERIKDSQLDKWD